MILLSIIVLIFVLVVFCAKAAVEINSTEKMLEWKEKDVLIYFLTPYSPELNLIEILWRRIKYQWMPFDAYLSFQNLKERLLYILDNVGSKYDIIF
ncbi:transposase [Ancylomarina sp. 16SWW S1-10-2]|uniref:transposase n=1 Tax=Ancylomarina sp. 16SWW S1-10-2 TaxID=2499681 RepID=UPI0012AD8A09|nr:transposase [Ancylomarina sp. 16SWW S1-10-2]MRT92029.1 hypothetical protein [Ancylomarina sp. 16SWW S1-10-2]